MNTRQVTLVFLAFLIVSCADAETPSPMEEPVTDSTMQPEAEAADGRLSAAADAISHELAGNDDFASVEVIDSQKIVVHWNGPVDPELRMVLSEFPELQISVKPTACSPAELTKKGRELLASEPAVNLVSVAPDGSGLTLTLDESEAESADIDSLQRKYAEVVGCPVSIEFGGVTPVQP